MPFFKTEPLEGLNERMIYDYVSKRIEDDAANATINRELATLRHLINRCIEWDLTKGQPKISMYKETLVIAAAGDHNPDVWMFVIIALDSGIRHSEILRIRWEDIDFTNKRIYVEKAKAGQRHQPLPPSLIRLIRA